MTMRLSSLLSFPFSAVARRIGLWMPSRAACQVSMSRTKRTRKDLLMQLEMPFRTEGKRS